jgi:hypothetical protein
MSSKYSIPIPRMLCHREYATFRSGASRRHHVFSRVLIAHVIDTRAFRGIVTVEFALRPGAPSAEPDRARLGVIMSFARGELGFCRWSSRAQGKFHSDNVHGAAIYWFSELPILVYAYSLSFSRSFQGSDSSCGELGFCRWSSRAQGKFHSDNATESSCVNHMSYQSFLGTASKVLGSKVHGAAIYWFSELPILVYAYSLSYQNPGRILRTRANTHIPILEARRTNRWPPHVLLTPRHSSCD